MRKVWNNINWKRFLRNISKEFEVWSIFAKHCLGWTELFPILEKRCGEAKRVVLFNFKT
jgi:hypothetical protein